MCNALNRVADAVRVIVERIDTPLASRTVMLRVTNTINRGVTQIHVRRRHFDFQPQHLSSVSMQTPFHLVEEAQVFFNASITKRRVFARLRQRTAIGANVLRRLAIDVGQTAFDEVLREGVERVEIVARVEQMVLERETQPLDHFFDRLFVLDVFLDGIGVVETQMAHAVVVFGEAKVQANRFCVADVKIAVGFRWEACDDFAAVLAGRVVRVDDLSNEVGDFGFGRIALGRGAAGRRRRVAHRSHSGIGQSLIVRMHIVMARFCCQSLPHALDFGTGPRCPEALHPKNVLSSRTKVAHNDCG